MRYDNKHTHTISGKIVIFYSNVAQSQMVFYIHQQHMVPDYCTKYEQNISQQTHKIYERSVHNYSHLALSQILFNMHQQPMVSDYGTE